MGKFRITIDQILSQELKHDHRESIFTNNNPTPDDVGGILSGTIFDKQTASEMFEQLLYPYQQPQFSTFNIQGQALILEVGDNIPASVTFDWSTNNDSNIQANTIDIRDITNATDLATGLANDGSEFINMGSPITKTTEDNNIFRITGTNTESNDFTKDVTYNWRWRLYYGEDNTTPLTETDIEGLRANVLTNTFVRTYSFISSPGQYKYICYSTSFGTAASFIDADTGLSIPFVAPYIVSVTNTFGQTTNYRVHRTVFRLGGSINILVS